MESTTATTVESTTAAAMEATATYVAMESTTSESASNRTGSTIAATVPWASVAITGSSISETRSSVNRSPNEAATEPIAAAEPGPCSDKDTAAKPRRAIVTVGCAGVGIVAVIAVSASRRIIAIASVHRAADSNTNCHLGVRVSRRGEQQNTEYSEIP